MEPELKNIPLNERGRYLISKLEKAVPLDLFRKLYPRQYEGVGQYNSPRTLALFCGEAVMAMQMIGMAQSPATYRILAPWMPYMIKRRMPLFFVSLSLVEAVKRTDFPDDINWLEMRLPYENGVLVLPPGSITHPLYGDCGYLFWSRCHAGDEYPNPYGDSRRLICDKSSMSLVGLFHNYGQWFDSTFSETKRTTIRMRNLFYRESKEAPIPAHLEDVQIQNQLGPEDAPTLEEIGVLVFGTLMAMESRPSLVESEKLVKAIPARKGESRREFWTPNIVGANYQPKGIQHGGTHSSPRMHWRRGHFRSQAHGVGRQLRKRIWLEPILVSAE